MKIDLRMSLRSAFFNVRESIKVERQVKLTGQIFSVYLFLSVRQWCLLHFRVSGLKIFRGKVFFQDITIMATRKTTGTAAKRSTSAAPKKNSQEFSHPSADAIARRAWEIWDRSGRPHGRELENWLQAESELKKS